MKNFWDIKNTFEQILIDSIINENETNKNIFKKYVKILKEDEILTSLYMLYEDLKTKHIESEYEAGEYIKNYFNILENRDKEEINLSINKLDGLLNENDKNVIPSEDIISEHITKLLFSEKTSKNLNDLTESFNTIKESIMSKKDDEIAESSNNINLPPSMLSKLMVDRFNEHYGEISENEKNILKTILDGDEEERISLFNETINDCVNITNIKLNETNDLDIKAKLLDVKHKLLEMNYNHESFNCDMGKLVELKQSIEND